MLLGTKACVHFQNRRQNYNNDSDSALVSTNHTGNVLVQIFEALDTIMPQNGLVLGAQIPLCFLNVLGLVQHHILQWSSHASV